MTDQEYAVGIVRTVCALAGNPGYLDDVTRELRARGILKAIDDHDTPKLFAWLIEAMSYQGISDAIAAAYMKRHGRISWRAVATGLELSPSCPKLRSHWQFHGCGYRKSSGTCGEPGYFANCPLPTHRLRNGNLNQLAYSLFLFVRDLMAGDLVGWLDKRLAEADRPRARVPRMREAVLGPLRNVYGASDKVLSVALSNLLLCGGGTRARWMEVGAAMIAIDTLVHCNGNRIDDRSSCKNNYCRVYHRCDRIALYRGRPKAA
jgi:hypothetical protein